MSDLTDIPGYAAGTWEIDTARSEVAFEIGLLGLFTTHGTFDEFEGAIVTAQDPLDSSVTAVIKTASVNTRNKRRDKDLRKDPYLGVEKHPTIAFTSTAVRADADRFLVEGDLTIRGISKRVTLKLDSPSLGADGEPQAAFVARTEVSCDDFGVTRGLARPFIGDKVAITLRIQATRQS